jgi:hypothetical protein
MSSKLDLIERIIATNDEKVLEKVGRALESKKGESPSQRSTWLNHRSIKDAGADRINRAPP